VKDKDGISAAVLITELAAAAKADGKTIFDTLDELYLQHGLHASDQLSIRVADLGLLDAMMNRLRVSPPESFGSSAVEVFTDLAEGSGQLPPTDGLLYLTRDLTRVIIRPSGTEPKLKCYLEVVVDVEQGPDGGEGGDDVDATGAVEAARIAGAGRLDAVAADLSAALGMTAAG
jgi:phosphomannomutase